VSINEDYLSGVISNKEYEKYWSDKHEYAEILKKYYEILEIPHNTPQQDIKKAYRKASRKYHPDILGDDKKSTEIMSAINAAYKVLSDSDMRSAYDELRTRVHSLTKLAQSSKIEA